MGITAQRVGEENFLVCGLEPEELIFLVFVGLNPTSALPEAISAAGPVPMKENSSFSFRIAHHRLVQRPQSSSLSALAIPRDERYGWRTLSFLSL